MSPYSCGLMFTENIWSICKWLSLNSSTVIRLQDHRYKHLAEDVFSLEVFWYYCVVCRNHVSFHSVNVIQIVSVRVLPANQPSMLYCAGVLWGGTRCSVGVVRWSSGPRAAYWPYLPPASGSSVAHWSQRLRQDDAVTFRCVDERPQRLPSESPQQVHGRRLRRGSEGSAAKIWLPGKCYNIALQISMIICLSFVSSDIMMLIVSCSFFLFSFDSVCNWTLSTSSFSWSLSMIFVVLSNVHFLRHRQYHLS